MGNKQLSVISYCNQIKRLGNWDIGNSKDHITNFVMRRESFLPAYCFCLLLWVMASLPGDDIGRIQRLPESQLLKIILSDPFIHLSVFGLLALLICRGYYRESRGSIPLSRVAILAIGYSFLIEIYQGILPWRSFGLDDVIWNTVGVLFFLIPVRVYKGGIRGVVEK